MENEYICNYLDMINDKLTAKTIRKTIQENKPERVVIRNYEVLELISVSNDNILGPLLPLNVYGVYPDNTCKLNCLLHYIEIELERLPNKPSTKHVACYQSSWMRTPSNIKRNSEVYMCGDVSTQSFSSALPIFGNCTRLVHPLYTDVDNSFTDVIIQYMQERNLPNRDGVILFGQSKRFKHDPIKDVYYKISNITVMGHKEVVRSLCPA